MVSTFCCISGTCHVTLVTNAVISHELGKNRFMITTNGTYLWSLVILVRSLFQFNQELQPPFTKTTHE
jgi:hypothetical protein